MLKEGDKSQDIKRQGRRGKKGRMYEWNERGRGDKGRVRKDTEN